MQFICTRLETESDSGEHFCEFRREGKLVVCLQTMYECCVYPAKLKSQKQVLNCIKKRRKMHRAYTVFVSSSCRLLYINQISLLGL